MTPTAAHKLVHILALETSGDACSTALLRPCGVQVREAHIPRGHTRHALPMVQSLLADAGVAVTQLDLIAFGRGPGSFTGVRIATALAQGLGLAGGVPLMGISTLGALACGAARRDGWRRVIACLDARKNEVYLGAYRCDDRGRWRLEGAEQVASAERVSLPAGGPWYLAGSGCALHGAALGRRLGDALAGMAPDAEPMAREVAQLARVAMAAGETPVSFATAAPVYLRDRVAEPVSSR